MDDLYGALGGLGAGTLAGASLRAPPQPRGAAPFQNHEPGGLDALRRHRELAAASLRAAGERAAALSLAEARVDSELMDRAFALANKVLAASGETEDRQELRAAMSAVTEAVGALRRHHEPPHGSLAAPSLSPAAPGALAEAARASELDEAVAAARERLASLVERATMQATRIIGDLRGPGARSRAVLGRLPAVRAPSDARLLGDRLDLIDLPGVSGGVLAGAGELRRAFDGDQGAAAAELSRIKARIGGVRETVDAAGSALPPA